MQRDLYKKLAMQLMYGKRLNNDDELDIPTPSYFEWKLKNKPEEALKEFALAVAKLQKLEHESKHAWKMVEILKKRNASKLLLSDYLSKAYFASNSVNWHWQDLMENGMAEYIPEDLNQ